MKNLILSLILLLILSEYQAQAQLNTDIAKRWTWVKDDNNNINVQGQYIKTYHLGMAYVNLPNGIEMADSGIKWTIEPIQVQADGRSQICFGVQEIDQMNVSPASDKNSRSIGICSQGTVNKYLSTETIVEPVITDKWEFMKYKWDVIFTTTKLTITNENYQTAENNTLAKIEFTLDGAKKYFPNIHHKWTDVISRVNKCGFRCETCNDWDEQNCLTCKDTPNIENSPTCACKPGFTDIYNYKQNLVCQPDTNVIWQPNHYDWTYLQDHRTSKYIDEKDFTSSDGKFRTYSSSYTSTYVKLDNGLQKNDSYDIIRWHVSFGLDSYSQNQYDMCIGIQNMDYFDDAPRYNDMNGLCMKGERKKKETFKEDIGNDGLTTTTVDMRKGNKYQIDYNPKLSELTITNLPFGGFEYVKFYLERQHQYFPNVIHFTNSQTYYYNVIYHKCLDRCTNCLVFQPSYCLACEDSANRLSAPSCACKPGTNDDFTFPNNYYVTQTCKPNYNIVELKNPDFNWVYDSDNLDQEDYDLYANRPGYINLYGDVGEKGIQIVGDAVNWQIRMDKLPVGNGYVCMGVQTSEQRTAYKNSHNTNQPTMCGLCTDHQERHSQCITNTTQSQKKEKIKKWDEGIGEIYNLTYYPGILIISNEEFGGDVRYEFELDEYQIFVPVIAIWSNKAAPDIVQVQLKTCHPRCESCEDWQNSQCTACNDSENRQGFPNCACKPGYEDEYDHVINKVCRPKIQWKEPQPPEWEWKHYGQYFTEDYENDNDGTFSIDYNRAGMVYLEGNPMLEDNTKWTIKIKEYEAGYLCFGVQDSMQLKSYYSADANAVQQSYTVSVCTREDSLSYYHRHSVAYFKQNGMPNMIADGVIDFDIYYQRHKLTVTNEDYGGNFRWEFDLYPDRNYTPYLSKNSVSSPVGKMVFQVKGCTPRCKSCVSWTPASCITCNDAENRTNPPNCECKENYYDYYDHRKQKICKPVPNLLKPAPPKWVWMAHSTVLHEDIENMNYGVFLRDTDTSYGSMFLVDKNIVEDGTQWEIKILDHGNVHSGDYICMGVISIEQARLVGVNSNRLGQSNSFCTNNSQYLYQAITGPTSKTKIYGPNTSVVADRDQQIGKTYTVKFFDDFMNVSDGGDIGADFELNPSISYTPYIYISYRTVVQLKGCSHRCYQCIDFSPKQCTICNDENYRQSAPSCLCKEGYYDTYDHKFNKKCIPKPKYTQMQHPDWKWYTESAQTSYTLDPQNQGLYDTTGKSGYVNFLVEDTPALQDKQKWTINMLEFFNSPSNYNWICFGITQLSNIPTWNFNSSEYTKSVAFCSTNTVSVVGSKGKDDASWEKFVKPEFTTNTYIDLIYETGKLIISTKDHGGNEYLEFELYADLQYTPMINMYCRYTTQSIKIQFQNCNLNCDSCVPWQPRQCNACKGLNRLGLPSCECQDGYTDYYDGIYHTDCIPNPNTVIGQNWNWEIKGTNDRIKDNLDGIFYMEDASTAYDSMYANVGREGIPILEEGVKWSINFKEYSGNTSDHICFGIQKFEYFQNQNYNDHVYNRAISICTTKHQTSTVANGASVAAFTKQGDMPANFLDNEGLSYDLIYKSYSLEVTNVPYGGQFTTVYHLNTSLKFIPYIQFYKNTTGYQLAVNTKPCAYKCETCNLASSYDTCTACFADTFRSGSDCLCNSTYYDAGTVECAACVHPCATCKSERICLTCISAANRDSNPPICSCLPEFFEDSNGDCVQCQQQCDGCAIDSDNCTACKVETGRSTTIPECSCLTGYYDDPSTKSCEQCHESCNKCIDNTTACVECKSNKIMTEDGTCGCSLSSYVVDDVCIACVNPCLMCEDETTCTSCRFPTPNRKTIPSCTCEDGYFEDENNRCLPCMEGCAICKNTATNCSKCILDANRNQDPTNCACNEGYMFDKAANLCKIESCPDKCVDCVEGSSTQCNTCKDGDYNRSDINDNCDCAQGYYEGGSVYCLQCNVQCKSCSNLSGCSQCASTLNRGSEPNCLCDGGYYEDGTGNCAKCHYKCKSCSGSPETCTQCNDLDTNRQQTGQCACNPGYEEDTVNEVCQERITCDFKCETCEANALSTCTKCLVGAFFRKTLAANCDCIDGYYDNKLEPTCQECQAPCRNCELDESDNMVCITCLYNDEFRNDAPNCLCPEGYIEDDNNVCKEDTGCKVEMGRNQEDCTCFDGFYDDPVYQSCLQCDPQCATCETNSSTCKSCALGYQSSSFPICTACERQCGDCNASPSDCTTCNLNRDTIPGCGCSSGYYDDLVSADCKKCNSKCGECSSFDTCITCATSEEGRTSASKGCKCKSGYFNDNGYCSKCDSKCLSCENKADYCIVCAFGLQRNFIAPTCGCNVGYHTAPGTNNCSKCSDECASRDNETGVYTNAAGGTYSFGVYNPQDKLEFSSNTNVITAPIEIPDTYVDDGEGNLVPDTYFEKLQTEKAIEEAQQAIIQQKQEAEQLQQQLEEQAAALAEQEAAIAAEQEAIAAEEAALAEKAAAAQQKEQELNTVIEEITQQTQVIQEKEAVVAQKEAEITNKQQLIADKQLAGEDTTALEAEVQQLTQEKATVEQQIQEAEVIVQEKEVIKQETEAEKLVVDQEVAAKEAEVQQKQTELQEKVSEVEAIQEEIQEKEQQVETISQTIEENAKQITDLGGVVIEDDGEGGTDSQDGNNNGGQPNLSVGVTSGNQSLVKCNGGCASCEEDTPDICKSCLIGIKRLNNPPLCTCSKGYYQQGASADCRKCPLTCSQCTSFEQCTECRPKSNRYVDQISGKCVCLTGFTEQRHGTECQRCYYYENVCYQSCPKNSVLDVETYNCLKQETQLEDIRITILIIGILAFVIQLSIFGVFVLLAKKRNFDKLFPKINAKPLQQIDQDDDSSQDSNSGEHNNSGNLLDSNANTNLLNDLPKITENNNESVNSTERGQIKGKQRKKSVRKPQQTPIAEVNAKDEVDQSISKQQKQQSAQQTPKGSARISFINKGSSKNTPKNKDSVQQSQNNSIIKFQETNEAKDE